MTINVKHSGQPQEAAVVRPPHRENVMPRKAYAVSIEDDSSGQVDWWPDLEPALRAYEVAIADPELHDQEINLFEVEAEGSNGTITNTADSAMWHRDYTPIRWRKGSAHSATPHATPPTD